MKFKQLVSTGLVIVTLLGTTGCSSNTSSGVNAYMSDVKSELISSTGEDLDLGIDTKNKSGNGYYYIALTLNDDKYLSTTKIPTDEWYTEFHPILHSEYYNLFKNKKDTNITVCVYDSQGNLLTVDGFGSTVPDPDQCAFCNKSVYEDTTLDTMNNWVESSIQDLLQSDNCEVKSKYNGQDKVIVGVTITDSLYSGYSDEELAEIGNGMATEGLDDIANYCYNYYIKEGMNKYCNPDTGMKFTVYNLDGQTLYEYDI